MSPYYSSESTLMDVRKVLCILLVCKSYYYNRRNKINSDRYSFYFIIFPYSFSSLKQVKLWILLSSHASSSAFFKRIPCLTLCIVYIRDFLSFLCWGLSASCLPISLNSPSWSYRLQILNLNFCISFLYFI